jgi:hypothetical protein
MTCTSELLIFFRDGCQNIEVLPDGGVHGTMKMEDQVRNGDEELKNKYCIILHFYELSVILILFLAP